MTHALYRRFAQADFITGGPASIGGVVRVLTAPAAGREVFLLRQGDFAVRRRTVSGVGGVYGFPRVSKNVQWLVLAIDPTGAYNAVVADRVTT